MIRPYYYIYVGGAGFLLGIVLAGFIELNWLWFYGFVWLSIVALIIFKNKALQFMGVLFFLFLALGWWRWQMAWPAVDAKQPAFYYNQPVTLEGYVSREVEQRKNHQQVIVRVAALNNSQVTGKVLVYLPLFPEYSYGDTVRLTGVIEQPQKFNNFSYDKYLARYNIYALLYYPQVEKLVKPRAGWSFYYHILEVKKSLVGKVNSFLPEPEAALLGGLLWGAKRSLPNEVLDNFNIAGTTHIVALSGYNITVLGLIIFFIAPWLGIKRQSAFWLVVGIILFFIIITGYPASVVRAGIMGILVLLSMRWGGGIRSGILLILSAFFMCLINPKVLLYDVGFQLSFLATIGLIYLSVRIEKYFRWASRKWGLAETMVATTAAIIMTAPLVAYQFARLSLIALLSNILILFIIPVTMALGFVSIIIGLIFHSLGQVIAWLAYLPLTYIINLTDWLASLPGAALTIVSLPGWLVITIYFFLFSYIFYGQGKRLFFSKN